MLGKLIPEASRVEYKELPAHGHEGKRKQREKEKIPKTDPDPIPYRQTYVVGELI